jgi:hypothetical protein
MTIDKNSTVKNPNQGLIIPNKGACGLKLGNSKKAIYKLLGEPIKIENISFKSDLLVYKNINLWIDSDKISQIGVNSLYEGQTKKGIKIGSTKEDVIKIHGSLSWDGTWHVQSPPFGIGFDFESDVLGQQYVSEIFIFEEYY